MSYPRVEQDSYYQAREDEQHLNLLALFHYIVGGLTMLTSCMFIMHIVIGLMALTGGHRPGDPPKEFGWIFIIMGTLALLLGWTLGGLTIYAGKCLKERRAALFLTVISGLNCLSVPLGTILGVFTLLVINRPSVKAQFDSRNAGNSGNVWYEQSREPRASDYDRPYPPPSPPMGPR